MRLSIVASRLIYRPSRITPPVFWANQKAVLLTWTSASSNFGCWATAGKLESKIASELREAILFIVELLNSAESITGISNIRFAMPLKPVPQDYPGPRDTAKGRWCPNSALIAIGSPAPLGRGLQRTFTPDEKASSLSIQ